MMVQADVSELWSWGRPVYAQDTDSVEALDIPENMAITSLLDRLPADPLLLVLYAIAATLICLLAIALVKRLSKRLRQRFDHHQSIEDAVDDPSTDFSSLSKNFLTELGEKGVTLVQWIVILCILYLYLSFVLHLSTWTERLGSQLVAYVLNIGIAGWQGFIDYLPNLATIIVIIVVTRYIIRVAKLLFDALGRGQISIPGFYRDWAEPTYRLIFFLCLAIAASIAFPLLPGASSPAVQGLTLLAGLLGAFGAKEAVANAIAGITLIYTRAFQVGDRIELEDARGTVLEKSLFVTRLLTPKNVVITIPNGSLIDGNIVNYSTSPKERNTPIVLYTTVTLGYDVPWRQAHEVLITAATRTSHILSDPPPFVLQKGLSDYSVSYELNAATQYPTLMERIYSEMFQHIQDVCREAEIEILSPGYFAIRDGNQTTIPSIYQPDKGASDSKEHC